MWSSRAVQADTELHEMAAEFGIDLAYEASNGGRIHVLTLRLIRGLAAKFDDHVEREDRLYQAVVMVLFGAAVIHAPTLLPAVERAVEILTGLRWQHGDISWSKDILEAVGGLFVVIGGGWAFAPRAIEPALGRLLRFRGKT